MMPVSMMVMIFELLDGRHRATNAKMYDHPPLAEATPCLADGAHLQASARRAGGPARAALLGRLRRAQ
eukprot:4377146-Pyramimonas_sp.AAC.1